MNFNNDQKVIVKATGKEGTINRIYIIDNAQTIFILDSKGNPVENKDRDCMSFWAHELKAKDSLIEFLDNNPTEQKPTTFEDLTPEQKEAYYMGWHEAEAKYQHEEIKVLKGWV
jgi:hypothetical protein